MTAHADRMSDSTTPTRQAEPRSGPAPRRPWYQPLVYWFCHHAAALVFILIYRVRAFHPERVPSRGAVLIAANHQSFFDPPLVGSMIQSRQVSFVAKSGLFSFGPFAWLIRTLNSVPIREDTGDAGAIKEVLRRLATDDAVVIFPEGSRTPDGAMHEFKRGVALLVKRADCPVVPVAVEGVFDAWPIHRKLPRFFGQRLAVMYGEPIDSRELMAQGPDAALRRLESEVSAMREQLRVYLRESSPAWPNRA